MRPQSGDVVFRFSVPSALAQTIGLGNLRCDVWVHDGDRLTLLAREISYRDEALDVARRHLAERPTLVTGWFSFPDAADEQVLAFPPSHAMVRQSPREGDPMDIRIGDEVLETKWGYRGRVTHCFDDFSAAAAGFLTVTAEEWLAEQSIPFTAANLDEMWYEVGVFTGGAIIAPRSHLTVLSVGKAGA